MTVSSTTSRWEYAGNGVTTAFAFDNRIFAGSDLAVYLDGVLQNSGYTVTGTAHPGGGLSAGNVTFSVAPAGGVEVTIVRDVPAEQPAALPAGGQFPSGTVERMADRAIIVSQQLGGRVDRTLRLADSDASGADTVIPAPVAGRALKWNAAADALELTDGDPDDAQSDAAASAAASAASAAAASTSAGNAATSATDSANSATASAGSATNSANSATAAAGSATAAAGSATAAAASAATAVAVGNGVLTTAGDIVFANATPTAARLPIGTTGQSLTVVGGLPAWAGEPIDQQTFNSTGTWTKPARGAFAMVEIWGPGGGGARRSSGNGGGGGSGGYQRLFFLLSALGATEAVTINAAGATQSTDNTAGNAGGTVTFGAHATHYGGRGGQQAAASNAVNGGGSGGPHDVWTAGASNEVSSVHELNDQFGATVRTSTAVLSASSMGGTGATGANAVQTIVPRCINGGGPGGGHSTTGTVSGVAGTSARGGAGGAGNASGAGGTGSAPGGGGGSGTSSGGAGGAGRVVVTVW